MRVLAFKSRKKQKVLNMEVVTMKRLRITTLRDKGRAVGQQRHYSLVSIQRLQLCKRRVHFSFGSVECCVCRINTKFMFVL